MPDGLEFMGKEPQRASRALAAGVSRVVVCWALIPWALIPWALAPPAQAVEAGEPAPGFALPSIDAEAGPIALADYRGKVLYLEFWSSWCAPCRRSMPRLDALRARWPQEKFEVVGLNLDTRRPDAVRFLERVAIGYPNALDLGGGTARRYGVSALPAAFVINADGVVERVFKGAQTEDFRLISGVVESLVGR